MSTSMSIYCIHWALYPCGVSIRDLYHTFRISSSRVTGPLVPHLWTIPKSWWGKFHLSPVQVPLLSIKSSMKNQLRVFSLLNHNWLVVVFFLIHMLGIMIPTDFHIFQRGRSTTNQITNPFFLTMVSCTPRYTAGMESRAAQCSEPQVPLVLKNDIK